MSKIISFEKFRKTLKELNCDEKMLKEILQQVQPPIQQKAIDRIIQQSYHPTEEQLKNEALHYPKDLKYCY